MSWEEWDVWAYFKIFGNWHVSFFIIRSTAKTIGGCWKGTGRVTSNKGWILPCGLEVGTSWDTGLSPVTAQSSMDSAGCLQPSCAQVTIKTFVIKSTSGEPSETWFHAWRLINRGTFCPWRKALILSSALSPPSSLFNYTLQSWGFLAFLAVSSQTSTQLTTPMATWWLRSTSLWWGGSWTTAKTASG